ncbi:hypothetical protein N665_0602s0013 [Sinapis alba]|nr:hypothetical protein N665_0602s0013 [Sinapis alba]
MTYECPKCGAFFRYNERVSKTRNPRIPVLTMCCMRGKIKLPTLNEPPEYLMGLLTKDDSISKHFRDNIRPINMMFSFTSLGGKIDNSVNEGKGPRVFKLHGENYHLIGSMKPKANDTAKFSQLYIHDTENEVQNRLSALSGNSGRRKIREDLVEGIMEMLRIANVHVKIFRNVKDRFNDEEASKELSLVLINSRLKDGCVYNLPTSSEVAALVVGDFHENMDNRDIILEKNNGKLKRINELHPCYLPLQYLLLFPYGEDGFRLGIKNGFTGINKRKPNISMREFFAYRIQVRKIGSQVLLLSRRLLQQFLVDAYTMIEAHRLRYIRKNQSNRRTLKFSRFVDSAKNGNSTVSIEELSRYLQKFNLRAEDRPELCCRLFKIKLDKLMDDLTKKQILCKTVSAIYTVEFQKRGLPHAHILLFMDSQHKLPNAEDIDRIISAEIPDRFEEPKLYEVVKDMMIHGPCGVFNRDSPCMQDGKCSKFFPRRHVVKTTVDAQGYPVYKRRDTGNFVEKKGINCDNRFVVPYNKKLLLGYNAHINVEWCNQSRSIKYLFKYINKGQDRVTGTVTSTKNKDTSSAETNQNTMPSQGVDITGADAVEQEVDEIKKIFRCQVYISSCDSTWRILAFPTQYRSTPVEKLTFHLEGEQPVIYKDGDTVESVLGRVHLSKTMFLAWFDCCEIYPEARELTYPELPTRFVYDAKLRSMFLNEIKTVKGIVQASYEEACYELGLLDDDKEYIEGLKECSFWASGGYVRNLFANMLLSGSLSLPKLVWESTTDILSEDVLYLEKKKRRNPGLVLSDEEVLNETLILIENILRRKNSSLDNFDTMPKPVFKLRANHYEWLRKLTEEQRSVYDQIIDAVQSKKGGVFFVYGFGGTGKTFFWNILSAAIRSTGDIVLNVSSSGIASLLLPGGRTAHSRFGIPINPDEFSTCNIEPGSDKAEVISKASLIVWDEAPMMSKYCFEALDRNMADIVMATMNSSYLWKHCKVLQLTKNMRLFSETDVRAAEEIKEFSNWILDLGDGKINEPNNDLLITKSKDPIESIVSEVYGETFKNSNDPIFFQERAILCPTNENVDVVNNYMLDHLTGEERIYLSSDSIDPSDLNSKDDSIFSPEFLNSIKSPGLPNHALRLKIGTPVMILRNIDPNEGLCNGTRLQITHLANHIVQAKVITGTRVGEKVFLHRVLLTPTDTKLPFKMRRRQFPLKVAFAMTINKSQGQSLERVGLFLPRPVFSHGQLYVAVSRVKSRKGLKILITDKDGNPEESTMNVVYKEVFQNFH